MTQRSEVPQWHVGPLTFVLPISFVISLVLRTTPSQKSGMSHNIGSANTLRKTPQYSPLRAGMRSVQSISNEKLDV